MIFSNMASRVKAATMTMKTMLLGRIAATASRPDAI